MYRVEYKQGKIVQRGCTVFEADHTANMQEYLRTQVQSPGPECRCRCRACSTPGLANRETRITDETQWHYVHYAAEGIAEADTTPFEERLARFCQEAAGTVHLVRLEEELARNAHRHADRS